MDSGRKTQAKYARLNYIMEIINMDRSAKILWVDDNVAFVRLVFEAMKDNNDEGAIKDILFAESADEAVAVYAKERPMMVLLDILMPGKDGIDCAKMIKAIDPGANISIVSNYPDDKRAQEAISNHLVNSKIDKRVGVGALAGLAAFIVKVVFKAV